MSKQHQKHGVIVQGKYRKRASKGKWTDREYHVQDNADIAQKYVNFFYNNQFPALPFCGPYPKPRGARELSKHYRLRLDKKLFHGICEILYIPCSCVGCTSILNKPWISGIPSKKQARYQPVTKCTYWPVMGSYNNWNIIDTTPKSTTFEAYDEIHQVFLYQISENVASLVQSVMYGAINTDYTTSNVFYVIQFISEAYTLQNNTTIDGKYISDGELVVKLKYLCSMQ